MPEPSEFEMLARVIVNLVDPEYLASPPETDLEAHHRNGMLSAVVDELKALWNRRGTADLNAVDGQLESLLGANAGPYVKSLDQAIQSLDR